jgi:hypothetical protein
MLKFHFLPGAVDNFFHEFLTLRYHVKSGSGDFGISVEGRQAKARGELPGAGANPAAPGGCPLPAGSRVKERPLSDGIFRFATL